MKRFFLRVIPALALVFGLVLAACENGTQEVTGEVGVTGQVSLPKISDPNVTLTNVTSGVKLSWPSIVEANGYTVYRKGPGQTAPIELPTYTYSGGSGYTYLLTQNEKGLYEYYDLVRLDNELQSNTSYTYTVIAQPSGARDIGKSEKAITTGTLPAKGSQAAAPASVALAINYGDKTITVTVAPPTAGNIPDSYQVSIGVSYYTVSRTLSPNNLPLILKDTDPVNPNSSGGSTVGDYFFQNIGGEYTATVYGTLGHDAYFESSDPVTDTKEVAPLFGSSSYFSGSSGFITGSGTASNTVTGLYAQFGSIPSPQPGVTYTMEKATLDANNKPGAFTAVNLTQEVTSGLTTTYSPVSLDFTFDIFGNYTQLGTVYDRSLPIAEAKYRYRIKAVRDGITDYKETTVDVSNLKSYIWPSVSVAAKTTSGSNVSFAITPSVTYKGLLGANDKLVLYWLRGDTSNSYRTGPYTAANSISFSKTELEAATVVAKNLTVPANGTTTDTTKYLFVQAYLEFADGTKRLIEDWSGAGVYYYGWYNQYHNGQYHVQLDY